MVGYVVGLSQGQGGIDSRIDLSSQDMADPAEAQSGDLPNALHARHRCGCLINQPRIDGVHQPSTHLLHR